MQILYSVTGCWNLLQGWRKCYLPNFHFFDCHFILFFEPWLGVWITAGNSFLTISAIIGTLLFSFWRSKNHLQTMELKNVLIHSFTFFFSPDADQHVTAPFLWNRKVKKGRTMKRSKNVRKKKSLAKAIAKNEQSAAKVLKNESKKSRTQSAKLLYEWITVVLLTIVSITI